MKKQILGEVKEKSGNLLIGCKLWSKLLRNNQGKKYMTKILSFEDCRKILQHYDCWYMWSASGSDVCWDIDMSINPSHTSQNASVTGISHNAIFCNRNVHMCAHFCYKMVHCGIFVWCILGFVRWVYCSVHCKLYVLVASPSYMWHGWVINIPQHSFIYLHIHAPDICFWYIYAWCLCKPSQMKAMCYWLCY